jgi:hypothetical protein
MCTDHGVMRGRQALACLDRAGFNGGIVDLNRKRFCGLDGGRGQNQNCCDCEYTKHGDLLGWGDQSRCSALYDSAAWVWVAGNINPIQNFTLLQLSRRKPLNSMQNLMTSTYVALQYKCAAMQQKVARQLSRKVHEANASL